MPQERRPTTMPPNPKEATVDALTTQWQALMFVLDFAIAITAIWLFLESTQS